MCVCVCVVARVGKYLRLKRIDFQLPYDIQWLWKHNQVLVIAMVTGVGVVVILGEWGS